MYYIYYIISAYGRDLYIIICLFGTKLSSEVYKSNVMVLNTDILSSPFVFHENINVITGLEWRKGE